jgi:hypothetical protein
MRTTGPQRGTSRNELGDSSREYIEHRDKTIARGGSVATADRRLPGGFAVGATELLSH